MNNKKSIGIMLDGGVFDTPLLKLGAAIIERKYSEHVAIWERKPTRSELASALGMDRWRLTRLLKALKIIDLF